MNTQESVGVFIQARMGSTRLPGKCMKPLLGKALIDWVLDGVLSSSKIQGVVVCVPNRDIDVPLRAHCQSRSIPVFQGSENDVLGRYAEASLEYPFEHLIRITADCPLVSGKQLDYLIDFYFSHDFDYVSNHIPTEQNQYPDGLGGELFSRKHLLEIASLAKSAAHREHLTLFFRENPELFSLGGPLAPEEIQFPSVKLDIDTQEDFRRMERLLRCFPDAANTRPGDKAICEKYVELFQCAD